MFFKKANGLFERLFRSSLHRILIFFIILLKKSFAQPITFMYYNFFRMKKFKIAVGVALLGALLGGLMI
jgi:hypothetical protein